MAAYYGWTPSQTDALTIEDLLVMLRGVRVRERQEWQRMGVLAACICNHGFHRPKKTVSPQDFIPDMYGGGPAGLPQNWRARLEALRQRQRARSLKNKSA